ncbi:MAG: M1 family metallopeptidase [Gammaproteobacteria bacterium]|nr:M1 family metallopeptidase [Gammaproteobacteria bacterium]
MPLRSRFFVFAMPLLAACSSGMQMTPDYDPARDYFSYANTKQFVSEHLELDLNVDFDARSLSGTATLYLRKLDAGAGEIVLDTRDLTIDTVEFVTAANDAVAAEYRFGAEDDSKGTPLVINLPDGVSDDKKLALRIRYATSPASTALQWLPPKLTAGGEHPMVFSQSQTIHARSWVPLQDTPSVRITYEALIKTSPELLAVMSANNAPDTPRDGEYQFEMPQPIPPYLLAIAVGNIYFAPIGARTGVYAEPELLDASVYEFADIENMLVQAEQLFGPYDWGRYDLLVLPPSFPFGGMENPRLSFITPSLLAGDRSLVSVVAHELAHSWSGNLVTNATWRDGSLNEGMTSYMESRLMEVIYDRDRVDEERVLAYEELLLDFENVPPGMQALAPRLDGGDPDDFQGTIHYHKGQLLLQYLENAFGREQFDKFLGTYFETFAFKTITTERFLDFLDANLLSVAASTVSRDDVEQWLYEPGLPPDAPVPTSATLTAAAAVAARWASGELDTAAIPIGEWSAHAAVHFINSLPADLSDERLSELDAALGLSKTSNAEIARTWFIQVAERRHEAAYGDMAAYLNRYGRGRLIFPIYMALANNGSDRELSLQLFEQARAAYHPLVSAWIGRSLGVNAD